MNASDWKKAAAFVNQQKQAAAIAPTEQLSSMPLSTLSLDNSSLPVVQDISHVPLAASTLNKTLACMQSLQQETSY